MIKTPVTALSEDVKRNLLHLIVGLESKDLNKYSRAMEAIKENDIVAMMNISNEIRNG